MYNRQVCSHMLRLHLFHFVRKGLLRVREGTLMSHTAGRASIKILILAS
jgi:hypothetical protein